MEYLRKRFVKGDVLRTNPGSCDRLKFVPVRNLGHGISTEVNSGSKTTIGPVTTIRKAGKYLARC